MRILADFKSMAQAQSIAVPKRPVKPVATRTQVVILAGGFGTRLAEHTDELPKPMVQIGGRPMLWHIQKIYSTFGYHDFLIACGYRADSIKRFYLDYREQTADLYFDYTRDHVERRPRNIEPWKVGVIDTGENTMTGGRILRLAEHLRDSTFMLTYGDGVANVDLHALAAFHREHGKLATFTAVRKPNQFGLATVKGDRVISFEEKPSDPDAWINGGFLMLEPGVIDFIDSDQTVFEVECLPKLARDGQLMAFKHEGFWHPMDTLRDVRNLNAMWSKGNAPWKVWTE